LEAKRPPEFVVRHLGLNSKEQKGKLFHSRLLHFENGQPLQLEERWIRSSSVPAYLDQDFSRETPSEYLHRVAPLSAVDYSVTAVLPDAETAQALGMNPGNPCLKLTRLSFSGKDAVAYSIFWHPGELYSLKGRV
jgi:GntR family histidine utilization transcriptional repressor